jgi:hypothetical protein
MRRCRRPGGGGATGGTPQASPQAPPVTTASNDALFLAGLFTGFQPLAPPPVLPASVPQAPPSSPLNVAGLVGPVVLTPGPQSGGGDFPTTGTGGRTDTPGSAPASLDEAAVA